MKTNDREYGTRDAGHGACRLWLLTPGSWLLFSRERWPPGERRANAPATGYPENVLKGKDRRSTRDHSMGKRAALRWVARQGGLTASPRQRPLTRPSRDGQPLPSARSVVPFGALPRELNHHSSITNQHSQVTNAPQQSRLIRAQDAEKDVHPRRMCGIEILSRNLASHPEGERWKRAYRS